MGPISCLGCACQKVGGVCVSEKEVTVFTTHNSIKDILAFTNVFIKFSGFISTYFFFLHCIDVLYCTDGYERFTKPTFYSCNPSFKIGTDTKPQSDNSIKLLSCSSQPGISFFYA